ncbi:MAG: hypothetical protein OWS74_00335, partial [Firmicutes bacterium]|nr:hypothetical protein [Bacillota bacterium]
MTESLFIGPGIGIIGTLMLWRSRRLPQIMAAWAGLAAVWAGWVVLSHPGDGGWGHIAWILVDVVTFFSAVDAIFDHHLHPQRSQGWYYLWWSIFWGALSAAALAHNVAGAWIAIEVSTLSSSALIGLDKRYASFEAAWKYVIIASVGL